MERNRPQAGIGTVPTPVEAMPDLGDALGVPNLYVKNESEAGKLYGGNKIRKLNYLFGAALESGYSRVVTGGGIGSNHVLATSVYAREVGLEPAAIQFSQPVTEHVQLNLRSLAAFDPDLHLIPNKALLPLYLLQKRISTRFSNTDYFIPFGGSSALGTLGYVDAVQELQAQIEDGDLPEPDVMVVPTSSGGTQAGLQVGVDLYGLETTVVGVRVAPWYTTNRFTVARLANDTAALIDSPTPDYSRDDVTLISGYIGEGYAKPTPAGERATEHARSAGLTLDPTYTAKTVAAIAGEFEDETVLYWHTLGETRPKTVSLEEARARLPNSYARFLQADAEQ